LIKVCIAVEKVESDSGAVFAQQKQLQGLAKPTLDSRGDLL